MARRKSTLYRVRFYVRGHGANVLVRDAKSKIYVAVVPRYGEVLVVGWRGGFVPVSVPSKSKGPREFAIAFVDEFIAQRQIQALLQYEG